MTIKSKVTTEVEKEIELPYFFNHSGSIYKVDTNESIVSVTLLSKYRCIMFSDSIGRSDMEYLIQGTPISEDEFNAAFDQAFASIANLQTSLV
jgi:hypothetical protein